MLADELRWTVAKTQQYHEFRWSTISSKLEERRPCQDEQRERKHGK